MIEKTKIKIKGQSVPVDTFFLDALSLKRHKVLYFEKKKEVNAEIREMVKKEDNLHPAIIERHIAAVVFGGLLMKHLSKKYF